MQPDSDNQTSLTATDNRPAPGQLRLPLAAEFQFHQGPIPRAQDLKAYERVVKGSADRIIKMAEKEQDASIRLRWGDLISQFASMVLGKLFVYCLFGGSVYLALQGKDAAAILTAIVPVLTIAYSTLFGEKTRRD